MPLACSPSPLPFTARAACLHLSTLCSLPGEPSWTVCHPQQTQAFVFLLCSEFPFMAHPARCFLLCFCTPLSETLTAPCLSVEFLLRPCPSLQENRGENVHNQPCSDGSPSPCTSSSFALTLPPAVLSLIFPYHRHSQPSQHPLVCLLPLICFFQHDGFAPLQAPREIKYHSTALQHLLLILLPTCSSSY